MSRAQWYPHHWASFFIKGNSMAKAVKKRNVKTVKKVLTSPFKIYWNKKNYLFLFLGFLLLIVGFYAMSIGSWDSFSALYISPIILFIAYLLIFPASIFSRVKEDSSESQGKDIASGKS